MATDGVAVFILGHPSRPLRTRYQLRLASAPPLGGGGHLHVNARLPRVALAQSGISVWAVRGAGSNPFLDSSAYAGEADPSSGRNASRIVVSCFE